MNSPASSLHDDIELIDEALEPFTSPLVNERSGLRWMQRTLEQRRELVQGKIAQAERSTLVIALRSADGAPSVPVSVAAQVLDLLQRRLHATADAVAWPEAMTADQRTDALALEMGDAHADDERWQVTLQRASGPFTAQPVDAERNVLAVDAALAALLEQLADDPGRLGELAQQLGLQIELSTAPATTEPAAVTIDRHSAPPDDA